MTLNLIVSDRITVVTLGANICQDGLKTETGTNQCFNSELILTDIVRKITHYHHLYHVSKHICHIKYAIQIGPSALHKETLYMQH